MTSRGTQLVQVRKLDTAAKFTDHLAALGVEIPFDQSVDAPGILSSTATFVDGSVGGLESGNRFAALPMEGWDATLDGRPTDLVRRRWQRIGSSGCGLVWADAVLFEMARVVGVSDEDIRNQLRRCIRCKMSVKDLAWWLHARITSRLEDVIDWSRVGGKPIDDETLEAYDRLEAEADAAMSAFDPFITRVLG